MASSVDLLAPMSQEGSGTSRLPSYTPMYGRMTMRGGDMLMLHSAVTPRFVADAARRGQKDFSAPNWAMAMLSHSLGRTVRSAFAR